ncbi:hypothetical protein CPLU01_02272 [Colletotrichum plurivorum]|uniref:BZIP domain-containing protein n=1 Tax=Colletotrichum plurivorum TaxID=2175906 RepID=A0A8H6KW37_9PEZI|nr:hypothetical protein CPLU01_02272 [Colletotrichum plurivorum]
MSGPLGCISSHLSPHLILTHQHCQAPPTPSLYSRGHRLLFCINATRRSSLPTHRAFRREAKEGDNAQTNPSQAFRHSGLENEQASEQSALPDPDRTSASTTGQDGQCPGPQGQECEGDQVSMSQRGTAPTSRPPSQSPSRAPLTSQQSPQARDNVPAQAQQEPYPQRSLGIRGLINPSEAQPEGFSEIPQPRPIDPQTSPYGLPPRHFGTPGDRPYAYQGLPGSQPATPAGHPPTTPMGLTPSDQHSPRGGFPFPSMGRQMLSPRETRAASVGQASMRAPEPQSTPFLPPAPPRAKRPYPGEEMVEPIRPPPGLPFSGPPPLGPPTSTMGPLTTPPRAMSQPMIGQVPPPDRPQLPPMPRDPRAPDYQGQPHPSMMYPGANYPPQAPSPGPIWPAPGVGTPLYQSLRSESAKAAAEGMIVRLGQDDGIIVPVDVHQASKQADEKRQRNAGASARFRQRKKEKDQEQAATMQKLEQRNRDLEQRSRDLEARMRDVTQERDFYREERNRLRDVVLRTPLSDLANGPPSPTSSRSGGSMTGTSPLTQAPMLPHQPQQQQQGYASSDASSVERPTRRRRTDSAPTPEFSMPSYGTPVPQPGHLPPMQAAAYGMMQQRPPSTTPGGERLPSLRAMEGPYGVPGSDMGHGPAPGGPGGPMYPSYTRVPHETGFASRTPGPPPGHHGQHGHDAGQR